MATIEPHQNLSPLQTRHFLIKKHPIAHSSHPAPALRAFGTWRSCSDRPIYNPIKIHPLIKPDILNSKIVLFHIPAVLVVKPDIFVSKDFLYLTPLMLLGHTEDTFWSLERSEWQMAKMFLYQSCFPHQTGHFLSQKISSSSLRSCCSGTPGTPFGPWCGRCGQDQKKNHEIRCALV